MENKQLNVGEILERLMIFFGVKTFAALAKKLGLKESTLNGWKHRETIDFFRIFPKLSGVDWHWLLTGEGEMIYDPKVRRERTATIEYLLNRVKDLETEIEIFKKLYYESLRKIEEVTSRSGLSEEQPAVGGVTEVPFVKLPDESKLYKKEKIKEDNIYSRRVGQKIGDKKKETGK